MQDKSAAAIACGNAHTVALTDNGNVWSWVSRLHFAWCEMV